jgi:hypothetical protein
MNNPKIPEGYEGVYIDGVLISVVKKKTLKD